MEKINVLISFNYHSYFTTFFHPFISTRSHLLLSTTSRFPTAGGIAAGESSRAPRRRSPAGESAPTRRRRSVSPRTPHRSPPRHRGFRSGPAQRSTHWPRSRRWLTLVTSEARKPISTALPRPRQTPRPADQCLSSRGSPVLVQCRAQRRATAAAGDGSAGRSRKRWWTNWACSCMAAQTAVFMLSSLVSQALLQRQMAAELRGWTNLAVIEHSQEVGDDLVSPPFFFLSCQLKKGYMHDKNPSPDLS